jgi:purine-nucleoside phosphorylase
MQDPELERAAEALEEQLPWRPEILVVLGSGLGGLADSLPEGVSIGFERIPGFPAAGVSGHAGRFIAGVLEGRKVLLQAGRFHLYEGHPPALVVAPIRVAARLGVQTVILSNAAGGIDRRLAPGDILLLDDQINVNWRSPLAGPVLEGEERFPDMSAPYDPGLQALALETAAELGVPLPRGVYAGVLGPSYETPAEVRMLGALGADAVGMSTVPEVVAARSLGLRTLGLSLVSNHAAGITPEPLSHDEVMEVGRAAGATFEFLVRGILARMA